MKTKLTKTQTIENLRRELIEARAQHGCSYRSALASIGKASSNALMGSGVIITLTAIGGRELCNPVMIIDGLSTETVDALTADVRRSLEFITRGF